MVKFIDCSGVTAEMLYNGRALLYKMQVKFEKSLYTYDVLLDGRDGTPDCKVSSITANLYFRTPKGIRREKYNSIKGIVKAVKTVSNNYGLKLQSVTIMRGEPAFI